MASTCHRATISPINRALCLQSYEKFFNLHNSSRTRSNNSPLLIPCQHGIRRGELLIVWQGRAARWAASVGGHGGVAALEAREDTGEQYGYGQPSAYGYLIWEAEAFGTTGEEDVAHADHRHEHGRNDGQ